MKVGPADDPANYMGPVISASAKKSIESYIEIGKTEGRLVSGGTPVEGDGYFLPPTVIADISGKARIFQEEIFGPVLAVTRAKDFEHALELANDSQYGLTGAVFSTNPDHIRDARGAFLCGESVCKPEMHGRDGRGASVRRLQHVRHGFEGRRTRLLVAVLTGEVHCGESRIASCYPLSRMSVLAAEALLTVEEAREIAAQNPNRKYELHYGELVEMTQPKYNHQNVQDRLREILPPKFLIVRKGFRRVWLSWHSGV